MIKADEFLEKIKKENLKFNDKVDIFHSNFKENNKYKIEDVENAEDYKIFKIIQVETGKEEYFIFTKRTFNIFKIDYKYPVFI
ncbi:hypothetical protein LDK28_10865 (plasmid) [Fusobacterium animalis]|mgnify:CR=1 FL=1|uniref:hypothetical protein n=1 Tax=Fusobacterium animalis TaxID=76859 RepID=UPI0030D189E8